MIENDDTIDVATLNAGDYVEVTLTDHQTVVRGVLKETSWDNLVIRVGAANLWVRDDGEPGTIIESVKLIKKALPEWAAQDVAMVRVTYPYGVVHEWVRIAPDASWYCVGYAAGGYTQATTAVLRDAFGEHPVTILAQFMDGAE